MAVINRVPQGLLPLLDAKTGGNTPSDFSGVLSPGIDLTEFYAADIPLEIENTQVAGSTQAPPGIIADVTVPAGEQWLVYGGSAICTYSSTALSVRTQLVFRPASPLSAVVVLAVDVPGPFSAVVGQTQSAAWRPSRPWIVRSGSVFSTQVWTGTYGAGTGLFRTDILFRRLQF